MSQDEIIVDKVNFIKRIAEKYDLVYEEHKNDYTKNSKILNQVLNQCYKHKRL